MDFVEGKKPGYAVSGDIVEFVADKKHSGKTLVFVAGKKPGHAVREEGIVVYLQVINLDIQSMSGHNHAVSEEGIVDLVVGRNLYMQSVRRAL